MDPTKLTYGLTISRMTPGKPAVHRRYFLHDGLCEQLASGGRVVVELEDGDYIKASLKGKEDDKA